MKKIEIENGIKFCASSKNEDKIFVSEAFSCVEVMSDMYYWFDNVNGNYKMTDMPF